MEEKLKRLIEENKVIPFVGAGVSKSVKLKNGKDAFIDWKELLQCFLNDISDKDNLNVIKAMLNVKKIDYLDVADRIEKELSPKDFTEILKQSIHVNYNHIDEDTYELAKTIWDLNSKLIITTNYDKVLHRSCEDKNIEYWDIESLHEQGMYARDGVEDSTVWNLHGHVDQANNMILTTAKYSELYSDDISNSKYKASLKLLETIISSKSLLFIGFSLDDPFIVKQLNKIIDIFGGHSPEHYILVKEGNRVNDLNGSIKIIEYENHGEPLIETIKSLQPTIKEKKDESKIDEDIPISKEEHISTQLTTLPKRNLKFVGRINDLNKIEKIFENDSITYIVNGIGGVGKSELAIEYFHKHKESYNSISFIELSEDGTSLEDIFLSKFSKEKLHLESNADFDTLIQRLQGLPEKNLLLVDNLDTKDDFKKIEMLNSNSNFDLLITTRITNLDINKENQLNLETLNDEDAKELFTNIYKKEIKDIDRILEYLDNHPLFINLTAKSLEQEYITVDELIEDIQNNNIYKIDSEDDKTFEEHLNDRFDRQFKNEQNDELKELLKILAIFPSVEIDFEILEKTITIDKLKVKLQKLVQRGWLNKKDDSYKLHQIIKTFIQKKYSVEYEDITFIFNNIASYIDTDDSTIIASQLSAYIPIIESFLNFYNDKEDTYICGILDSITYLYYSLGKYKKSLEFQEKAFDIRKEIYGENSEDTAKSYDLLSSIYQDMGELPKALEYQNKALKLREEVLGDKHPSLATSYNNISMIYKAMGELPKALEYQNKALKLREEILGDKHPSLATSYNNISLIYQDMGDLPKALEYQNKSLKLREEIQGDKHPSLATSYNNISMIYKAMGDLPKALEYQKKDLEITKEILGDKHSDLATSYNNISLIYKELKECIKAKEFMEKAIFILEEHGYKKDNLFSASQSLKEIEFNIKKESKIKVLKKKGKICKDV